MKRQFQRSDGKQPPAFVLYDGKAKKGKTAGAEILDEADSEKKAICEGLSTWRGVDAVWFERKVVAMRGKNRYVCDEILRSDLPPYSKLSKAERPQYRNDLSMGAL